MSNAAEQSLSSFLTVRRAADRGHADHGWLDTRHTFSFAHYYDPEHMGFRALRVINDDRVIGGAGFPTHPHRDMDIISYVVDGSLEHRDSMGNGSVIRPGEVQRMSAGTGVTHSEYNGSKTAGVRFLQIWIVPDERGIEPSYEQRDFTEERRGALRLVASRDGREGSVTVHQDLSLYATELSAGTTVTHPVPPDRYVWVQMVRGRANVGGVQLHEGDGASLDAGLADELSIHADTDTELLVFELA
ncbi:MAG: pirin family protein [Myxococcota bacterium]